MGIVSLIKGSLRPTYLEEYFNDKIDWKDINKFKDIFIPFEDMGFLLVIDIYLMNSSTDATDSLNVVRITSDNTLYWMETRMRGFVKLTKDHLKYYKENGFYYMFNVSSDPSNWLERSEIYQKYIARVKKILDVTFMIRQTNVYEEYVKLQKKSKCE